MYYVGYEELRRRELLLVGVERLRRSVVVELAVALAGVVFLILLMLYLPVVFTPSSQPRRITVAEFVSVFLPYLLLGVGVFAVLGVLWLFYTYLGWSSVGDASGEFSAQKTGVKLLLVSAVVVAGAGLFLLFRVVELVGKSASVSSESALASLAVETLVAPIIVLFLGAMALLVARLILAYGFYKLGDMYGQGAVKYGGLLRLVALVLDLIPLINAVGGVFSLISTVLLLVGLGGLRRRLQASMQPTPFHVPPPPT